MKHLECVSSVFLQNCFDKVESLKEGGKRDAWWLSAQTHYAPRELEDPGFESESCLACRSLPSLCPRFLISIHWPLILSKASNPQSSQNLPILTVGAVCTQACLEGRALRREGKWDDTTVWLWFLPHRQCLQSLLRYQKHSHINATATLLTVHHFDTSFDMLVHTHIY